MARKKQGPASRTIGKVTKLADVAKEARVGISTASRIVRKQGSFSATTERRVHAAIAKLGYVPNRIAGTLASTRSRLIGMIIPSLANIVFPDLLRGASSVLEQGGLHSVIGVTEYDAKREQALIESILAWRPAGLIVAGLEHTKRSKLLLRGSGIRIVELLDIDGTGIDIVVGYSNRAAGRSAAGFLLSKGYRRIGYVGHNLQLDLRAAKRMEGFVSFLEENGLILLDKEVVSVPSSIEVGRDGLQRLLARSPQLDAVYFSNDDMAMGGYFHCLKNGISIPGKLALFGHNGLDVGRLAPLRLSTIRAPLVLAGETAARLVSTQGRSEVVDLGYDVIPGETC